MKYGCFFTAEYFDVEATEFQLEIAATLDCSGRGSLYHGLGSGSNSSSSASGAGHGSAGGSGVSDLTGGLQYGSIYQPALLGARGGSGPGGKGTRGGGRMRIRVGHKFILDGVLKSDGSHVMTGTGILFVLVYLINKNLILH